MAVAQRMSMEDYEQFVVSGVEGAWELHDGQLVEKLRMGAEHGVIPMLLGHLLLLQIDRASYQVVSELRVRRPLATVFLPDLMIIPASMFEAFRGLPGTLAIFVDPLPLVVEVWSPSTGDYDVETNIPVYMQRGDLEIWRIHPYERTVTSWVRQDDGTYRETVYRSGEIRLAALPGVEIAVDDIFDF
jgi:Uma2 family endonuclease